MLLSHFSSGEIFNLHLTKVCVYTHIFWLKTLPLGARKVQLTRVPYWTPGEICRWVIFSFEPVTSHFPTNVDHFSSALLFRHSWERDIWVTAGKSPPLLQLTEDEERQDASHKQGEYGVICQAQCSIVMELCTIQHLCKPPSHPRCVYVTERTFRHPAMPRLWSFSHALRLLVSILSL